MCLKCPGLEIKTNVAQRGKGTKMVGQEGPWHENLGTLLAYHFGPQGLSERGNWDCIRAPLVHKRCVLDFRKGWEGNL